MTVRLPVGKSHLSLDEIVVPSTPAESLENLVSAEEFEAFEDRLETGGDGATGRTANEIPAQDETAPLVLLVEDNVDVRSYVKGHLSRRYRVVEAVDGLEALEHAGNE